MSFLDIVIHLTIMVLLVGLLLVWYGIIYLWYGHQGAPDVVEASVKSHLVEDFLCHPAQRKLSIENILDSI